MAKPRYTEQFMDDAETIWSPKVRGRLLHILRMLEAFPEAGSAQVPTSISNEFGDGVRKCALNPFDIVYEYDTEADLVTLLGLISQKRVW